MITLHSGMDSHSLEIRRDGLRIGDIQWHDGRPPRIVMRTDVPHEVFVTVEETEKVIAMYRSHRLGDRVGV